MTCEVPRYYIPVPDLSGVGTIVIPLNITDPNILRQVLQDIVDRQSGTDLPVPGQIAHFTATTKTGGILLQWDRDVNSFAYVIFRNSTNDLTQARTITDNYAGAFGRQHWFDKGKQDASLTARYYWIAGYNKANVFGPVTGPVVSAEISY